MAKIENGLVSESLAKCAEGCKSGGAEDDSSEDADSEGIDSEALMKEDSAEDDAEVVDERRDGLVDEDFSDKKPGADDSAYEKEELRGKQHSRQRGAERCLLGIETAEGDMHVIG